jgi:membrane protease YdiL (CAAX protease family)
VGPKLREMGRSFALYLPVVFVLEEVFFRGGLDSYLNRSDDRDPWVSAAFVAAIWGLWHMPLLLPALLHSSVSWAAVGFTAVAVMAIHCVVGTPLALFWRSSGLLFVPAFVHALIDAVRNGAAVR